MAVGTATGGVGVPSVRRLKTASDVRVALSQLYRAVEAGTMELAKARVLIYAAATLGGLIASSDIEKRLDALEAQKESE